MTDVWLIFVFGLAALVLLTSLQLKRVMEGSALSPRLMVLFGLILISTLGVALASSKVASGESKTAAFTLLGTIAGYLVSVRSSSADNTGSKRPKDKNLVSGDREDSHKGQIRGADRP
jgi:hypothetical protein